MHIHASSSVLAAEPPNRGGAGRKVAGTASLFARVGLPEPDRHAAPSPGVAAMFRYIVSGDRRRYLHELARLRRAPQIRTSHRRAPRTRVVRRAAAKAAASGDGDGDGDDESNGIALTLHSQPDSVVELAAQLGAIAADLWLAGQWDVQP